jgi:hypothetical protein
MLDNEVKVIEKQNSSSMPTLTETPNEGELPIEVVLAILYTQAKSLEKRISAQVLTGKTPKGEPVTYIRMTGVVIDKEKGFVLAEEVPTVANTANGG